MKSTNSPAHKLLRALAACLLFGAHVTAASTLSHATFDDFQFATVENWTPVDSGTLSVVSCPGSGSACLRAQVSGVRGIKNESQWQGDFATAGIIGIEAWLRKLSIGGDLAIRIGITDGSRCYVSAVPAPLPGGVGGGTPTPVRFSLKAADLVHVTGPGCSTSDNLTVTLRNVTQVRLFSAATPSWTPDAGLATILVDNVRVIAAGQTQWKLIGRKDDPMADCPVVPGWVTGHFFGNVANPLVAAHLNVPAALRMYCLYRLPVGVPATATETERVTRLVGAAAPNGLSAVGPDALGVGQADTGAARSERLAAYQQPQSLRGPGSASPLEDALYPELGNYFRLQAGRPVTSDAPMQRPFVQSITGVGVRLALLDTQPSDYVDRSRNGEPVSLHGLTLKRMASWLICDQGTTPANVPAFTGCVAEVTSRVALAFRCFDQDDLIQPVRDGVGSCFQPSGGGYTGLIGELARAVWDEVNAFRAAPYRLVLSGSLTWDPTYGGGEASGLVDDMPVAVRATYDALLDANCRGVISVFAAGNAVNGPVPTGPALPAAWESRTGPLRGECTTALSPDNPLQAIPISTPGDYYPLLHAAGGVQADNVQIANAKLAAEPRIVMFADHAALLPIADSVPPGDVTPPEDRFATLTGTSVPALTLAATAAVGTHYSSGVTPWSLMNSIYDSGIDTGRPASLGIPTALTNVQRVRLCEAISEVCGTSCSTLRPCPVPATPTGLINALGSLTLTPTFDMRQLADNGPNAACNGDRHFYMPGPPPPADLQCPHHLYFSSSFRTSTDPAPEDQPCGVCSDAINSPGTLYIEIDAGYGQTYGVSDNKLLPLLPTLVCDDHFYNLPVTLEAGSTLQLKYVPDNCSRARRVSLFFTVGNLVSGEDRFLSIESPVLRLYGDTDNDGVVNIDDNCTLVANAAQRDTDGDGIGNACDTDLDNSCFIDFVDLGMLKAVFFTGDADSDFNGDGIVDFLDLGLMKSAFFGSPGPSGVSNVCDVPLEEH